MTVVLSSRTARRRGILFVALLVTSLLLMVVSGNGLVRDVQNGLSFALRPVQGALDDVGSGIASVFAAVSEIDHLRGDNAVLREENERLVAENERLAALRRENDQLTALLQLRTGFELETAAARVVARDSSEFRRLITIDAGSDQGLEVGDVVITGGGALAGRIQDLGTNYARVVLLSDPAITVVGEVAGSGATGEVTGQLGSALQMSKIDATQDVRVGGEVLTAGIVLGQGVRSPYPKGLVIGTVVEVVSDPNAVVKSAFLMPAADLSAVSFVLVVLNYEGGLPEPGEAPADCTVTDEGTLPIGEQPCASPAALPSPATTPKPAP